MPGAGNRVAHRLLRVHPSVVGLIFAFWVLQFLGWIAMLLYVQFLDPSLGRSVLYVTQISHWALVEAAGTAALSSWALLQSKRNERRIADLHEHVTAREGS